MVLIRCRTFLGCLPLGSGVWVLALAGFLVGVTGAIESWMSVMLLDDHPTALQDEVALFAQAIIFSLLGLACILGFTAGFLRNRSFAFVYSKVVAIHAVFMLLTFGYVLYSTFRPISSGNVFGCTQGSRDELIVQFCSHGWSIVKGIPILLFSGGLLVQSYAYVVAINFADKLDQDEAARLSKSLEFFSKEFSNSPRRGGAYV